MDVERALRPPRRPGGVGDEVRMLALDLERRQRRPASSLTRSAQSWSRPGVAGASRPSRLQVTTCSTDGTDATASSAISFIGTTRAAPERAVGGDQGLRSRVGEPRRDRRRAKPEKIGTWTAPRCAHACDAIAASRRHRQEDRRPCHPRRRRAARAPPRAASPRCESSLQVSAVRPPSSARSTAASESGRSRAQRWTHASATFSLAPVNHVVHSIPRESSSDCVPAAEERDRQVVAHRRARSAPGRRRDSRCRCVVVGAVETPREPRDVRGLELRLAGRPGEVGSVSPGSVCTGYGRRRMRSRIFAEENRKWLTLAAVSFGLFMIMLDNTVVNVALPSIQNATSTPTSPSSSGS